MVVSSNGWHPLLLWLNPSVLRAKGERYVRARVLPVCDNQAEGCKSGPPSWAPPSPEQFPPPWERSNIRCGFVW